MVEPLAIWLDRFIEQELGIVLDRFETLAHPQEDYFLVSDKYSIFVVADGVTLSLNKDGTYPVPSGAYDAAKMFCEKVIEEAENRFENFSEKDLTEIFRVANSAVGEYNKSQGRTRDTVNFADFDFFATTGAFAILKDDTIYWASICDSYVTHFDGKGNLKFKSSECWPEKRYRSLPSNWYQIPANEKDRVKLREQTMKRVYRNGVNEKGEIIGYGVVTGEKAAELYLNQGSFKISEGDLVFLFTDGFEHYFEAPDFIKLFLEWPSDLETRAKSFTKKKSKQNPLLYSHERTLVAVSWSTQI